MAVNATPIDFMNWLQTSPTDASATIKKRNLIEMKVGAPRW